MKTNKDLNLEGGGDEGNSISQWQGFIHSKCPRCRVGLVFEGSVYGFNVQKMIEVCDKCGLKFERKPGYFYIAMFSSYGLTVAQVILFGIATYSFGVDFIYENLGIYLIIITVAIILMSPFNYRYSRMALLYWLSPGLSYDPSRIKKENVK